MANAVKMASLDVETMKYVRVSRVWEVRGRES